MDKIKTAISWTKEKIASILQKVSQKLGATKAKLLGYGILGVIAWYGIIALIWLIKLILCLCFGVCILI